MKGNYRHGYHNTPIYNIWKGIKARCLNPKHKYFMDYGGRGITICDRWKESFLNFLEDMGERPFPKAQIDRKHNNEGYTKDNCHWATSKINNRNRRDSSLITFQGETLTVAEWAEKLKVDVFFLYARKRKGWSDEDIISRPCDKTVGRFKKGNIPHNLGKTSAVR